MYADPTLMDLAAAYAKRRNGRKTKHAVACDRPGAKAKFAQPPFSASDLNALKRLVKQYEQQAKTSKGKQGPNGENLEFKALSIAGWMQEMINYAQAGQTHRAYSIVRTSNPDYVRFLPPSLVKAAWDVTKMSRPGAKAKMGANEDRKRAAGYKWQVRYTKQLGKTDYLGGSPQVIEDTVYFATESAARDWANTMLGKGWFKGMGGSPEKVLTAKVLMFSRPGSKSTHAVDYPAMLRALDNTMLEAKANGLEFLQSYKIARQVANSRVLRGRQATAGEILDARKRLEEDMAEEMGQSKHSRPGAKAKSTHAAATPAMRDIEKKMRELMREADALTAQSLSATISSEKRDEIQDKIERISDMLDVLGEDLGQQRKAAGFAKSTHAALPPQTLEAERKPGGGSHSEAVSRKIATLINEGKPQDQAVAIALDLERRGEL